MPRTIHFALTGALLLAACDDAKTEAKAPAPKAEAKTPAKTEAKAPEPVDVKAPEPADAKAPEPIAADPAQPSAPIAAVSTGTCDEKQAATSKEADERAKPYGIVEHLQKNFPDMKVSWLMKETPYQNFVVETGATNFGRCDDTGCYLFAAPTKVIEEAVTKSMNGDVHDPAVIGQALGLPAKNFEGPLRMMTLDLHDAPDACVRLPVDSDPGVWKCQSEEDTDCFKFGGYTSGNVPEVMVINAPVDKAAVKEIQ
ncbi:hypothetical protein [Paraliomyxa miuraensis]|uniref:hypothetical protein n=1 Tax=Paraliomyxa miuraensis TaxID=376150 RepID=UPI0022599217|nr:hypothetical protein [Paraliomyxa miuraensis]MCX4242280.1 hypothetical protein [Paraliomyxa miuraensis]